MLITNIKSFIKNINKIKVNNFILNKKYSNINLKNQEISQEISSQEKNNNNDNNENNKVRVRFAPSPTGSLHIGGARTALFNYLYAKKNNGKFILRIEDTDEERSTKESETSILNDLDWLGLKWDEGPIIGGPCEPYRQSDRKNIYLSCAQDLINKGLAYRCFCTEDEIEAWKQKQLLLKGHVPHYQSKWRDASQEEIQEKLKSGASYTVRFRIPDNKIVTVDDIVRGHIEWDPQANLGDFVILRSNGVPVYNFCVAVDDILMNITHVIRAEEHLSNTLRQLLVIQGLNGKSPVYAHCSLILGPDRSKLSKRHGATSISEFKKQGYLPTALINYLSTIGWNDGTDQEIYTVDELINAFTLDKLVQKSAMFDQTKLQWINKHHLKNLTIEQLEPTFIESLFNSNFPISTTITPTTTMFRRFLLICIQLFLESKQMLLTSESISSEIESILTYPIEETLLNDKKAQKLINSNEFQLILKEILNDSLNHKLPIFYQLSPEEIQQLHSVDYKKEKILNNPLTNKVWNEYLNHLSTKLNLPVVKLYHPLRLIFTGRMKGSDIGLQLELLELFELIFQSKPNNNNNNNNNSEKIFKYTSLKERIEFLNKFKKIT